MTSTDIILVCSSCGHCPKGIARTSVSNMCCDFVIDLVNDGFNINALSDEFKMAVMKRAYNRAIDL